MNHVNNDHEKLVKLLGNENPESRQELLNEIDIILCDHLKFKEMTCRGSMSINKKKIGIS